MNRRPIDDIELAAAIAASIQFDGHSPEIIVNVTDGVVTLEGTVRHPQEREEAEAVVRQFDVRGVINTLTFRTA